MHDDKTTRYVIKRIKKIHAKHHGGAWKIAYADFITAMMAFFLLMWLLSLLNKYQLQGISNYFKKPLKDAFTQQDNISHKSTIPKPIITGAPSDKNFNANSASKQAPKPNEGTETTSEQIKEELEASLASDPQMAEYKNLLNFVVTNDGLKIELRDLENKPMFTQGKTDFQVYANKVLSWLGNALNNYPNRVMIVGHTDSIAYRGAGDDYSNWELSSDRANATRRSLVKSGMDSQKVIRIVGVADNELLDKTKTDDASNRRIEIIVLSAEASKKIRSE
jgi:chemotaxis protein MotB